MYRPGLDHRRASAALRGRDIGQISLTGHAKSSNFDFSVGPKNRLIGAGNKFSAVWSSHLEPVGSRPGGKQKRNRCFHFRQSRARIRLRTRGRCQRMAGAGGLVASKRPPMLVPARWRCTGLAARQPLASSPAIELSSPSLREDSARRVATGLPS